MLWLYASLWGQALHCVNKLHAKELLLSGGQRMQEPTAGAEWTGGAALGLTWLGCQVTNSPWILPALLISMLLHL